MADEMKQNGVFLRFVSFQFRNGQYTHHNERKGVG